MISSFNHRLLLIEQALMNNGAVLAQLQLLELDPKSGVDASTQSDHDESDQRELDVLRDWAARLRAQVARTERRIERLRASVERHDAQLTDIKSRIIWSSAGCAVVRPHSRWSTHVESGGDQRQLAASNKPINGKTWPLSLQIPRRKLTVSHTSASPDGGSWSARSAVDSGARGVAPQLSRSFTSLLSVKRRQQSEVRVSTEATSSLDSRLFDVPRDNLQRSKN